ncbi:MAG: hypothetical protein JRI23_05090 [Deltaproteobacteria bacterium]|nr:hypothetical protein [Deltaproteobacteria bacterium]MBW2530926.1 hypothetical protein [Deltaproteobacteria bacterium]
MTQPAEREEQVPSTRSASGEEPPPREGSDEDCRLIHVYDEAPEGYDGTCLRPLGLCELGGACDACWYNSNREDSIKERPERR